MLTNLIMAMQSSREVQHQERVNDLQKFHQMAECVWGILRIKYNGVIRKPCLPFTMYSPTKNSHNFDESENCLEPAFNYCSSSKPIKEQMTKDFKIIRYFL